MTHPDRCAVLSVSAPGEQRAISEVQMASKSAVAERRAWARSVSQLVGSSQRNRSAWS